MVGGRNLANLTRGKSTMKNFSYISLILLFAISLLSGCETTRSITASFSSSVDEDLFAQVPTENRAEVEKAEFDLKIAEARLKLAEMNKDLTSLREKYSSYEKDAAAKFRKEAETGVDLAKWEAVDSSGLGSKEENTEKIADLKAKKLGIEADRIKIEAKRDNVERKIDDLSKQIEEQETIIINLEAEQEHKVEKIHDTKTGEAQEKVRVTDKETGEVEKEQ
jgi:chromosome segregation ATPase